MRLLITSRTTITDLEKKFEDTSPMEILGRDTDITKYLEAEFQKNEPLKDLLGGDKTLKDDIIKTIVKEVKGMLVTLPSIFFVRC